MTNLKNFAARQLSKKEMNITRGGQRAMCFIWDADGNFVSKGLGPEGSDFIEVRNQLNDMYADSGFHVTCHEADPVMG